MGENELTIDQSFTKGPKAGDQFLVVHEASSSVVGSAADDASAQTLSDGMNARASEFGIGARYSVAARP